MKTNVIKTVNLFILVSVSFICLFAIKGANAMQTTNTNQEEFSVTDEKPSYSIIEGVAALVGENVISTYDIKQRARLFALFSGIPYSQEYYEQTKEQILKTLVEEELMIQNAAKYDIDLTDEMVNRRFDEFASQFQVDRKDFIANLAQQGIFKSTLLHQIKSEIAWSTIIRGLYGNKVKVSPERVNELMREIKENAKQYQVLISEICLEVPNPEAIYDVYANGIRLVEAVSQGTPFELIAKNYSSCPSSSNGGDLGWQVQSDLPPELGDFFKNVQIGSITRPVLIDDMLKILLVRSVVPPSDDIDPIYTVAFLSSDKREADIKDKMEIMIRDNICNPAFVNDNKDITIDIIEGINGDDIAPHFRETIKSLYDGEYSKVIQSENSYDAIKICNRDDGIKGLNKSTIENRLYNEQIELLAARHLRNLKRTSAIDIRLQVSNLDEILAQ